MADIRDFHDHLPFNELIPTSKSLAYLTKEEVDITLNNYDDVGHKHLLNLTSNSDNFNQRIDDIMDLLTEVYDNGHGQGNFYDKLDVDEIMNNLSNVDHTHDFSVMQNTTPEDISIIIDDLIHNIHPQSDVQLDSNDNLVVTSNTGNLLITDSIRIVDPNNPNIPDWNGITYTNGLHFNSCYIADNFIDISYYENNTKKYLFSSESFLGSFTSPSTLIDSIEINSNLCNITDREFLNLNNGQLILGGGFSKVVFNNVTASSFNVPSASRFKKDISFVNDCMSKILDMKVYKFKYNGSNDTRIGFMEDEIEAPLSHDKTISLSSVMAVALGALKELFTENQTMVGA
jgi:hypothetical protein